MTHFIREWRKKRGYSTRQLAARTRAPAALSYASISRIETCDQSFTMSSLNAIAGALNLELWMLFVDPNDIGEMVELFSRLPPEKKRQATAIIKALADS